MESYSTGRYIILRRTSGRFRKGTQCVMPLCRQGLSPNIGKPDLVGKVYNLCRVLKSIRIAVFAVMNDCKVHFLAVLVFSGNV